MNQNINIKNKKASFEYELHDKFIAGIVLTGTEIKSIREGKASFVDAFCCFENEEFWIKGLHISEYSRGSYYNHDPRRDRKLLLNSKELKKIKTKINEKGFTVVPLRLFIEDNRYAKVEISLARGKAAYDKRETMKKRDAQREMDRSER